MDTLVPYHTYGEIFAADNQSVSTEEKTDMQENSKENDDQTYNLLVQKANYNVRWAQFYAFRSVVGKIYKNLLSAVRARFLLLLLVDSDVLFHLCSNFNDAPDHKFEPFLLVWRSKQQQKQQLDRNKFSFTCVRIV